MKTPYNFPFGECTCRDCEEQRENDRQRRIFFLYMLPGFGAVVMFNLDTFREIFSLIFP